MTHPNTDAAIDYLEERVADIALEDEETAVSMEIIRSLATALLALTAKRALDEAIADNKRFADSLLAGSQTRS